MNIRVALIDDDQSVRKSLGRLLHVMNIETVGYSSAEAFIEDPDRAQFGCVLLDVQLGGMTGLELQRRLKAEQNPVPVIFITAFEDPAAQAEAERIGCAAFFHKTDPGTRIIHAIRQSVERAAK
jgi:FixJ family two-component response regulator